VKQVKVGKVKIMFINNTKIVVLLFRIKEIVNF
jgi:hypothetical protein